MAQPFPRRSTADPGHDASRLLVSGFLGFWALFSVLSYGAADLIDPAAASSARSGSAIQPSYRGQAQVEALGVHGTAARLSGSGAVARAGFAIVDQKLAPSREGTVVAHATAAEVVARTAPYPDAPQVSALANPNERGGPLVFQATGLETEGWIEVLLPVRPNGTTGWIRRTDVELTRNPYRIEVDASAHRLTIFNGGRVHLTTTVAIGTGDTPTPIGDFYLVELLRPSDRDGIYGPYAYGLSGYSDTLDSFNGGTGVIGIHGTNRPDLLGQDVSHGCVRVGNPTIEKMVGFLPLGTPVSIFRSAG